MTTPGEVLDLLDFLIVGGGPGGTAAAFRARELGLSTLVVDYDDVLKRIRDYSKDKLILPNFGGGDTLRFPKGGELLRCLYFSPIDKDEMHRSWKQLYAEHGVPVRVGLELTALERRGDGAWEVRCWDHGRRAEEKLAARHVALSIGRGVPRRFDIPGNTDGIAFRLSDPALYVGRPACVLGGGTSAAEAVIAISAAKAATGDATEVYWSYRGDKLPKVSKALADAFFEAYLGNGNVRYCPRSEPVAVVTGEDREEYLAIRIDRRSIAGRPFETTHLEFAKESCIACIGEDIPETLLKGLGIPLVADGNRKRMLVNRWLETVQPNVYLVGDILSQSYLETDDFAADPAGFREVKHRGNIKSALRDGVLVAEVVARKLAGRSDFLVELEDAEEAEPTPSPVAIVLAPPEIPAISPIPTGVEMRLVRLLPGGVEAEEYPLRPGSGLTLGKQGCDLSFPDDPGLAERHASLAVSSTGVLLREEGATSGVFVRARAGEPTALASGAILRAGRQFLVVTTTEIRHFDHQGKEHGRHPLTEKVAIFGREAPDVTLDAADFSLSRRHLSLTVKEGAVWLKDLKSANGTLVKIDGPVELADGDEFRLGRQSFRLEGAKPAPRPAPIAPVSSPSPVPAAPAAAPSPAGGASVTFQGHGTFPLRPGQTLCEVAEEHGIHLNAECHAGICGSDPLRILSGREFLSRQDRGEAETLQDNCNLPDVPIGDCRLACMARLQGAGGPVVVEIVRPAR